MPTAHVLDSTIAYREAGAGPVPMVFLHGNPTSSYLWRNVLPITARAGRCLAPDLIGMGESGKPDLDHTVADHARYLDAWFDALALDQVVLIGHDWGGALAFDWAASNPGRVRGVAFTETILAPLSSGDLPPGARGLFESMRTPGVGEDMVLERNSFIEENLPRTVATGLSEHDLDVYRQPYPTPRSRAPLLAWARSLPLDGRPAEVVDRVTAYGRWLATSPEVPKLLLSFEPGPGTMTGPAAVEWCAATVSGLEIDRHGVAGHHTPEDQPDAIGESLVAWATRHDLLTP
ncbi:haloalkane dehalogenase [Actinophytocola xinjiangensis]|uniref:Haloalkane dehalogenase n=1 Tax=Actinophytocola xinjiangensis TaxID=485602 RepID=A0A7Z0WEX5_9PSEU|nr:haloalkane dehalogenase [Actinophytocola xinjiangensis]OLF05734.1 haloalkane dehalogenase [Actinophytocola xinjiangensis]